MIQIIMNTCKPKYGPQVYYLFRITITIYLTSDTDIKQILMVHYKHTRPLKSKGNKKKKKRDTKMYHTGFSSETSVSAVALASTYYRRACYINTSVNTCVTSAENGARG